MEFNQIIIIIIPITITSQRSSAVTGSRREGGRDGQTEGQTGCMSSDNLMEEY